MLALTNPRNAATATIIGTNPYAHAYDTRVDKDGRFQDGFVVLGKWLRRQGVTASRKKPNNDQRQWKADTYRTAYHHQER